MSDAPTFGRYSEIPIERRSEEEQAAYDEVVGGPRGRVSGPFRVWLDNPPLVRAISGLDEYLNSGLFSLSPQEREIAILVTATSWRAVYVRSAHEEQARAAGLPNAVVEAILADRAPALTDDREQIVYDLSTAVRAGGELPRALYDRAMALLGHRGLTDLIALLGHYSTVSLTVNVYCVPATGGGTVS